MNNNWREEKCEGCAWDKTCEAAPAITSCSDWIPNLKSEFKKVLKWFTNKAVVK